MPGRIRVFRGMTGDGKPEQTEIFATGLKRPYGIAFYPPGAGPALDLYRQHERGDSLPVSQRRYEGERAPRNILLTCPSGGGHWTRALEFSPDGKKMFVAVGSASNVDDPDTHPGEKNRADILVCDPDELQLSVYASGIRNAGRRDRGESADRRVVVLGERTRRAGRQPGARLHHTCRGGRLLRLAVVVHRRRIKIRGIRGSIRS